MYYILRNDGSFIFELPYPLDFCLHCLFNLIDNPDPNLFNCKLVQFEFTRQDIRPTRPHSVFSLLKPDISNLPFSFVDIDLSVFRLA